jgi:hypothetical protein
MSTFGPNLRQLEEELAAAGVTITHGLGYATAADTVHTYDENGEPIGLPSGSDAVVDEHDPQPIVDPRVAVIEGMDSISDADKSALLSLLS